MKRGIFILAFFMPLASYKQYLIPLAMFILISFFILFGGACLHPLFLAEKEDNLLEILIVPMHPHDYEEGRGLVKIPNYSLSECTGPTCIFGLASNLMSP